MGMLTELNNLLLLPQQSTSVTDKFLGVWYLICCVGYLTTAYCVTAKSYASGHYKLYRPGQDLPAPGDRYY
jgi:hypothetical protein